VWQWKTTRKSRERSASRSPFFAQGGGGEKRGGGKKKNHSLKPKEKIGSSAIEVNEGVQGKGKKGAKEALIRYESPEKRGKSPAAHPGRVSVINSARYGGKRVVAIPFPSRKREDQGHWPRGSIQHIRDNRRPFLHGRRQKEKCAIRSCPGGSPLKKRGTYSPQGDWGKWVIAGPIPKKEKGRLFCKKKRETPQHLLPSKMGGGREEYLSSE